MLAVVVPSAIMLQNVELIRTNLWEEKDQGLTQFLSPFGRRVGDNPTSAPSAIKGAEPLSTSLRMAVAVEASFSTICMACRRRSELAKACHLLILPPKR